MRLGDWLTCPTCDSEWVIRLTFSQPSPAEAGDPAIRERPLLKCLACGERYGRRRTPSPN